MSQLKIDDLSDRGVLAFDLRDILHALGPDALGWTWVVSGVEPQGEALFAVGSGAADLEALERSGEEVSGSRLAAIADRTHQVIWGEFRAFRDSQRENPWLRIIAFDSSWYEVWCEDEATLTRVRSALRGTRSTTPPIP